MKHSDLILKIDVLLLLEKLGIEGNLRGKEFIAKCPFPEHDDSTPSFNLCITGEKAGLWRCFGCGSSGNIIHLVQRLKDIDYRDALNFIYEIFGLSDKIVSPSVDELLKMLNVGKTSIVGKELIQIPLPRPSESIEPIIMYLMNRRGYDRKSSEEIVGEFALQYSDKGYYCDRLIIPMHGPRGGVVSFEASDVTGKADKKKLYPKGTPVASLIFNNHRVHKDYVFVVEGIFDAIRVWSFGEQVVSTFGAHLTDEQAAILINKYQNIIMMYDGDDAGRNGQQKAIEVLSPYVSVWSVNLRFGDPDQLKEHEFKDIINYQVGGFK